MSAAKTEKDGSVTIIIDGEERQLIPTVKAALNLNRIYGGLTVVLERVKVWDIDAIVNVVRLGLNLTDKESKDLPQRVYDAGIINLLPAVLGYVFVLANGGTRKEEKEDEGEPKEGNA